MQDAFVTAAKRSVDAGFRVIEIHAAHGYLFHEFLSPLSNHRTDQYGGSFENRTRFLRDTVAAVRKALPDRAALFVRISSTDWIEGGWDIEQSVELARQLKSLGVDVIDCSSGGNVKDAKIPIGAGYQTPFAARVRREAGIATAAVGLITGAAQADQIDPQRRGRHRPARPRIAARSLLAAARGGESSASRPPGRRNICARRRAARRSASRRMRWIKHQCSYCRLNQPEPLQELRELCAATLETMLGGSTSFERA